MVIQLASTSKQLKQLRSQHCTNQAQQILVFGCYKFRGERQPALSRQSLRRTAEIGEIPEFMVESNHQGFLLQTLVEVLALVELAMCLLVRIEW
jgi:hypothetical protein